MIIDADDLMCQIIDSNVRMWSNHAMDLFQGYVQLLRLAQQHSDTAWVELRLKLSLIQTYNGRENYCWDGTNQSGNVKEPTNESHNDCQHHEVMWSKIIHLIGADRRLSYQRLR